MEARVEARVGTTGRRDLLVPAIATAQAIADDFVRNNPPFSGGERDAIDCLQLYRATRDTGHLDLAKHYVDIRGLENSVNRRPHCYAVLSELDARRAAREVEGLSATKPRRACRLNEDCVIDSTASRCITLVRALRARGECGRRGCPARSW